ncbi:hypothetical protein [Acrocarpospora catenulata]|uniref:hypothetical protein n=1 Tax=Acrocarpospora catenulata TaxID=2836182 RepID=UPI001BDA8ED6|nr:hypothetical protein [Acrocarpospora catenulata]
MDDDEAARLHREASGDEQIHDLCMTVASAIHWGRGAYDGIYRQVVSWRKTEREDPLPCLPLLAVAVLAATRMKGSGGRGAHGFYLRFAELLTREGIAVDVRQKYLQGDFERIRQFWVNLDEWLKEQAGARGVSTLGASKGRELIGYAQSQAIICAADHDRLIPFFRDHRGQDAGTLLKKLGKWTGQSRLSRSLQNALTSGAQDVLLQELLTALSAADTAPATHRRPSGLVPLRLRFSITDDLRNGWTLKWYAERIPGIEHDELEYPGGRLVVTGGVGTLYGLSGDVPDIKRALERGLHAQGKHLRIDFEPQLKPLILQADTRVEWAVVDRQEPGVPSLLLFDAPREAQAKALVKENHFDWLEPEESSVEGWFVASELEFGDSPSEPGSALRLLGGLRVQAKSERQHYLIGGEPDIVTPPGVAAVLLDGRSISTSGGRTRLRGRGLSGGKHVLKHGSTQKIFYLHEPQSLVADMSNAFQHPTSPTIEGATVIYADGHFTDLAPANQPTWWSTRGTGLGGSARTEIPEDAVWLVIDRPDGTIEVRLLRTKEPCITQMTPRMRSFWSQMILIEHPPAEAKLWRRYCEAALQKGRGRV